LGFKLIVDNQDIIFNKAIEEAEAGFELLSD
jgi:hypothetical protein